MFESHPSAQPLQESKELEMVDDLQANTDNAPGEKTAGERGEDRTASVLDMIKSDGEARRSDVSAATIGRMLGLVTQGEFTILQGKVDLLLTRISTVLARMERIVTMVSAAPSGTDLERIDVQIGSLRSMLRDSMEEQSRKQEESKAQSEKLMQTIRFAKSEDTETKE